MRSGRIVPLAASKGLLERVQPALGANCHRDQIMPIQVYPAVANLFVGCAAKNASVPLTDHLT